MRVGAEGRTPPERRTMSGTYLLFLIMGAATLLLWGIRMARTSVTRAHGPWIRRWLPKTLGNRFAALATGVAAAAILQSSTAVAVFLASLASLGAVPPAGGLAVMLGADVGSAVVAALLTLNLKGVWPLLILAGYLVHTFSGENNPKTKQHGRLLLGLGMVLIALTFMAQVSGALTSHPIVLQVVASLAGEPLLAVFILAVLTWLAHSSIAILVFLASLAAAGAVADPTLVAAAVLGINLGGGVPAVVLTWRQTPAARRIILGNALFRLAGVAVCLPFLDAAGGLYAALPGGAGFRVVLLHILFNVALSIGFVGFLGRVAQALERLLPTPPPTGDEADFAPRYIPSAAGALQTALPLSALSRETLRVCDVVQYMLEQTQDILGSPDAGGDKIARVRRLDDKVDNLYRAIRTYAIELTRSDLSEDERRRATGLLRYAANLEIVGDIVDKSLLDVSAHKAKKRWSFSEDGEAELTRLFAFVIETMQLSAEVIMSWRVDTAETLFQRKREFKIMTRDSAERHIDRLQRGVAGSLETSSYHLNIIDDLQRINTLIASIAYEAAPRSEIPETDL